MSVRSHLTVPKHFYSSYKEKEYIREAVPRFRKAYLMYLVRFSFPAYISHGVTPTSKTCETSTVQATDVWKLPTHNIHAAS